MAYTKDEQRFTDQLRVVQKLEAQIAADWGDGYWPNEDTIRTFGAAVDKLLIAYCDRLLRRNR